MVISPTDFSLWARLTGNKYHSTPKERAKKGPEVQNFIQNLGKKGILGGKEAEEPKKENNLGKKIATGALIAGGVAAAVAAGRDKRVQDIAQRAAANTRTKIDDFLVNFAPAQNVDVDIVNASGDVTPDPRQQQANVAPQLKSYSESKLTGQSSRIPTRQQGPMPPKVGLEEYDYTPDGYDDIDYGDVAGQEEIIREHAQLKGLGYGDQPGYPERDPVSGYDYRDIQNKLQDIRTAPERDKQINKYVSYLTEIDPVVKNIVQENNPKLVSDKFKPVVKGETFGTSGAISKATPLEDIGNAELRARRTYGPMIDAIQQKNPGINARGMGRSMLAKAEQDRDFDLAYMVARGQGRSDADSVMIARETAGFPFGGRPGKPTEYRKFLGEQKTSSIRPESIDNLLNLVKTGPQINLPESVQEGGALVQLAPGSTPSNKVPTMGATIGGSSLTDQLATKNVVDNVLDDVRKQLSGEPKTLIGPYQDAPIKSITIAGPSNVQRPGPDTVVKRNRAGDITDVGDANYFSGQRELPIVYSTQRETNQQLRRKEFTPEQVRRLTEPKTELSSEPPSDPTSRDSRMDRLEQSLAETKAMSENLGRVGELLAQSSTGVPGSASISKLVPGTNRFDSARAAGYTTNTGITSRITNPRFQEKASLGEAMEKTMPTTSRLFYEQDSEGRIIPETIEKRKDRPMVIGKDNRTIVSGGGYQPRGGVGSSIGAYGLEPTDFAEAKISQTPTESPTSFTQAPGKARGPIDIVVSGGRANNNEFDTRTGGGYGGFKAKIDNIINQMEIPEGKTINIISGGASGVDSYAEQYANEKMDQGANFTSEVIKPDWTKGGTLPPAPKGQKPVANVNYDPAAGGVRNQKMINKAEAAIVFEGGTGTEDFTRRAEKTQETKRLPIYRASETGASKSRFAGESFDVARQLQKIQTDQSASPSQRRINAANFIKDLETDTILRSID